MVSSAGASTAASTPVSEFAPHAAQIATASHLGEAMTFALSSDVPATV